MHDHSGSLKVGRNVRGTPDHLRALNKSGKRLDAVDSVLQGYYPRPLSDQGDDGRSSLLGVKKLYGEDHNIDSSNARGTSGSPDIAEVEVTKGALKVQAVQPQLVEVGPSRNEDDIFASCGESCTEIAADAA
jgi:hypothetical protein